MDLQAYIASGILERYALGETTEQEMLEVEALAAIYPEIQAELDEIQLGLEDFAKALEQAPPPGLKARLLEQFEQEAALERSEETTAEADSMEDVPADHKRPVRFHLVAYLGLFILLAWSVVIWNQQNKELSKLQTALNQSDSALVLSDSLKLIAENQLQNCNALLENINGSQQIILAGTENYPEQNALVFWNAQSNETHLLNISLPRLNEDQDYQLWAIVNDQPVDLGVLAAAQLSGLQGMKSIEKPVAFAITIEPKGGSKAPTLEKMVNIGKLS